MLNAFAKDLWILLLDILAVNAAYFLALILRFYVNFQFRPTVSYYLTDWLHFTPFYTVACIIVFILCKLYGGMWRYAGINDMNRIIGANVITAALHVVGTLAFIRRMPITYYVIGAILQFLFIVLIRFGYRMLLVEKQKLKKTERVPALVVGSGDLGRKVVRHLEDGGAYAPVAVAGTNAGRSMDGIPVVSLSEVADTIRNKGVQAIFIADMDLSAEQRKAIEAEAGERGVIDYTGALSNMTGAVPVTGLLETIPGPVAVSVDGQTRQYETGAAAIADLHTRYLVTGIRGDNLTIDLVRDDGTAYLRQHQAETGEELSFF